MTLSGRSLLKLLAYGVVALATVFFVREMVRRFDDIPAIEWTSAAIGVALLSCLTMLVVIAMIGLMWFLLLKDQGVNLPLGKAIQIVGLSQIGKYLPGNVGQFAGRAVLAKQEGIALGVSASTMMIEALWTLAIGAGFAATALLWFTDTSSLHLPHVGIPELAGLTVALLFLPWCGIHLLNRLMPGLSRKIGGGTLVAPPRLFTAVAVSALVAATFFLLGWIVQSHAERFFHVPDARWVEITVLFTAAWLVGYVIPGAPGGLGVREALMLVLLTPILGAGPAVGVGITVRLATMAGDGLAFLLALGSKRLG
jgi:hypothetical protein